MCTDVVPASSVHIVLHEGLGGVGIGGATDNNGVAIRNGTISGFRIGIRFLGVAAGPSIT